MAIDDIAVQIHKLISGACVVAYADPDVAAVPTNIVDFIAIVGDPVINEDWNLWGATKGGSSYDTDVKSEELKIDQRTTAVFEDITDVGRIIKTAIAEMSTEHWKILEQSPEIETIAAAAGKSEQKLVRSGSFTERDRWRIAFIAQRRKSQGLVVEPGGATRGCYVVGGFYSASLSAGSSSTKFDVGALATRDVEFKAFPETTLAAEPGQDIMFFFEEQPGTIAA